FGQAVRVLAPHWQPEFKAGRLTFGGRAGPVLTAAGAPDLLAPLADLARNGKATADVLAVLAAAGGPSELELVLREAREARVLEELASAWRMRRVKPAGDPTALLQARVADPATRPGALALAGLWKVDGMRGPVTAMAKEYAEAMDALAAYGETAIVAGLAGPDQAIEVRRRAAAALAAQDLPKAAALAAPLFGEGDPGDLVLAFLRRSGGAEALGSALKDAAIDRDAARLALRAMGAAGREDRPLWEIFQKAAGLSSAAIPYSPELVSALLAEARAQGDPARGEKVFRGAVTNCVACHAIGGAGGKTGPELGEVGTALPGDLLVESLLWPNRQVKENYTATLVGLDDGRILRGYRVREDKEALFLRDPATERIDRLPRKKIERSKDVGSLMPEGVTQGLTRAELRDLVRFLLELGRPGPWHVSHATVVRHWEVETAGGWARRPSRVDGSLPLEELPRRAARFAVEGSRFTLKIASPEGLAVAGRPATAEMAFDLPEGLHVLPVTASPAYASALLIEVLGAKPVNR
ncbi:MAG TPA: hypothetical protein VEJ18_17770, partial [Planctomycetota bacterium]|nr:hypothetical protein [Planctomycetota bacterium]